MKWLIVKLFLFPLICRNYKLRENHKLPDTWYWADVLLAKWGYTMKEKTIFIVEKI